jgi:hypothetical protein
VQPRVPTHAYADPLDRIWLTAASRIGLRVERTDGAYASTSGDGVLLLASREHLDPDDSLAQMIFHELCHSLVQGEGSFQKRDWGLDNETASDSHREEACLRVQATLAARHGLRRFFAPTTDYRAFYDALPQDALAPRHDPTIVLAVSAVRRAAKSPWAPHLEDALTATRRVAAAARDFASAPFEPGGGLRDLWGTIDDPPAPHPSGLPGAAHAEGRTCGTCVWRHGRAGECRQAEGRRVKAAWPACERWEPALDCLECGACCRAAYDCVVVSRRDPVRKKHPELIVVRGPYLEVRRDGDRCSQLNGGPRTSDGGEPRFEPYTCKIYEDRPRTCRDFENAGEHCLTARRRVGMTL